MTQDQIRQVSALAQPLAGPGDLDALVERLRDVRIVLLGEASHGTSDFYRWRAELTQRLIAESGFSFVAVEGDWPDCHAVSRWVKGLGGAESARQVLDVFRRWPTWMWANEEVAEFVTWLRAHDDRLAAGDRVGFYGLDVYSLWDSLRALMGWIETHRPDALETARRAWRCLEPYGEDPHEYAWATRLVPTSCEDDVVGLLVSLRTDGARGCNEAEARLDAEQNAEVVSGAERYYRTMVAGGGASWNVRDTHMVETLDRLLAHHGPDAKAVVWAHNTHVGDARATDMAGAGMVNVGQLVRERHGGDDVAIVGFGSHHGEVIAAQSWGAPMEVTQVPPARPDTHEDLLHQAAPPQAVLVFPRERGEGWLAERRGHRAVGVVYHPAGDRAGNWVPTVIGRRYDAFLWFDETEALRPYALEPAPAGAEHATEPWTV